MRALVALSLLVLCVAPAAAQQTTDLGVEVSVAEVRRLEIETAARTAPVAAATTPSVLHITANVDWQLEAAAATPTAVHVRGSDVEIPIASEWTPVARGEAGRWTLVVETVVPRNEMSYRIVSTPEG